MGPRFWIGDLLKLGVALAVLAFALQLFAAALRAAAPVLIPLAAVGAASWLLWWLRSRRGNWQ
jgi:hypothetical protein